MHELTNNIILGLSVTQLEKETGMSKKGYRDLLLNEVITRLCDTLTYKV